MKLNSYSVQQGLKIQERIKTKRKDALRQNLSALKQHLFQHMIFFHFQSGTSVNTSSTGV